MGLTYVDSSVMIDALNVAGTSGQAARNAIRSLRHDELLVTSPLVDLECLVRPIRSGNRAWIESIRAKLATFRHLKIDTQAFDLAAHMRAMHGFKTADAIHLATASLGGCNSFWTQDKRILKAMPDLAANPCAAG